ncbi:gamma interferon inducible lysosomal thiol reductase [Ostertagia ostertagi]
MLLLVALMLIVYLVQIRAELPPTRSTTRPHPLILLERDLENLQCLFFRRNCSNHLADFIASKSILLESRLWMPRNGTATPKLNTVKLEIYMESQCPDTSRFMHKQLMKAWSLLSQTGRVELVLVPFGKARCTAKGDNDFECSCQHQANECILNQLMNCVIDSVGFPDKIVPVIDCIQGKPNIESAMESCIAHNSMMDLNEMYSCATGPRGRRLLAIAGSRNGSATSSARFCAMDYDRWRAEH